MFPMISKPVRVALLVERLPFDLVFACSIRIRDFLQLVLLK